MDLKPIVSTYDFHRTMEDFLQRTEALSIIAMAAVVVVFIVMDYRGRFRRWRERKMRNGDQA